MVATCAARKVGSANNAAMPPAGMASTIEGTISSAPASRAVATNCVVVSGARLPSTVIVVASWVEYQNGETWRSELPYVASVVCASGSVQ